MSRLGTSRRTAFERICTQAGHAVRDYRMIADRDRLLVGLSGGEDSLILMHVLYYLQRRAPVHFEILAATVDMGFAGFDGEALSAYCAAQGWEHEWVHLDGVRLLAEKNTAKRPCALCSRLRRGKLHDIADQRHCNKIVLGQQLDDLAVSLLMGLFRGNGIKTMGPHVSADGGSKRLIRPLCYVPKSLIHEAGTALSLPPIKSCPYTPLLDETGDRALLHGLLGELDSRIPNLRQSILASLKRVEPEHLLDRRFLHALQDEAPVSPAPVPGPPLK